MIEEYMLLANTLVAEKLSNDVPEVALLRRHEAPVPNKLVEIVALCNKLGYSIDGSSAHTLHQTLETVEGEGTVGPVCPAEVLIDKQISMFAALFTYLSLWQCVAHSISASMRLQLTPTR